MAKNTQAKNPKNQDAQTKEQRLIDKIEKAKSDLLKLQNKRKTDIGKLAYKHGLEAFSDAVLDTAFEKLAKELAHEHK